MSITLHTKETPSLGDSLKKLWNCKIAMKYKKEADKLATTKKWRDIHKIWAEYKGKPKKEAVANFTLKTGHDCQAAHLRKIGNMNLLSAQYTKCQTPPWIRNICYIALNLIPTNKCSRTPSNSTGMPEQ